MTTMHHMSHNRWGRRSEGVAIRRRPKNMIYMALVKWAWKTYTDKTTFQDVADNDMQLRVRLPQGGTVDVMLVDEEEPVKSGRLSKTRLLFRKGVAHIYLGSCSISYGYIEKLSRPESNI